MKKIIQSTVTILLVAMICTTIACKKTPEVKFGDNEAFKKETTKYGAYNGSHPIIELETNKSQIAYDDEYTFISIQSNDQSKYVYAYVGKYTNFLDVKDKLLVNISSKGLAEFSPNKTTKMEVMKIEGNKMWIWSTELAIGLIIKIKD